MRRRLNAWPAFVDLFSCLLIGTFAGLILQDIQLRKSAQALKNCVDQEEARSRLDLRIEKIARALHEQLSQDRRLASRVHECGGDVCLDLDVHFGVNSREIAKPDELQALSDLCPSVRHELEQLDPDLREDLELVIEGHTDSTQVPGFAADRNAWLYNWDLSAQRAGSVLYVFDGCGLRRPNFQVTAVGLSHWDPDPACVSDSVDCRERNRRTTLKFRVNTERAGSRASRPGDSGPASSSAKGHSRKVEVRI